MVKGKLLTTLILFIFSLFAQAQTVSFKRGFCGDLLDQKDLQAVENIGWFYNWGQNTRSVIENEVKDYIDYTPMAWGSNYNPDALRTFLSHHPEIKYLLGFNEPNFLEQANLTPTEAAALWPELESVADEFDLKLVSPAVNFSYVGGAVSENGIVYTDPVQYLDDFFAALPDSSRVDYIAIHGYFDNTGALPWYVSLFQKYNKPIWVTEFNHSDGNNTTETSQQNFMVEAVDYFENEPKVFRYAWLLTRNPYQLNTNLFENGTTGNLTDLGIIYTNMSSYDKTFFHQTDSVIEAEHYSDMDGVHLTVVGDSTGILAAHDFDGGDFMSYNLHVDSTTDYVLKMRITSIWESSFTIFIDNRNFGTFETPVTATLGTWETINFDKNIRIAKGDHQFKIVTRGGSWQLNWFQVSAVGNTTSVNELTHSQTEFFIMPNPATDNFKIRSNTDNFDVSIYNLTGNQLYNQINCSSNTVFNISRFARGTYLLKMNSKGRQFIKKLIIH